jgi:hypothetical protein
MVQLQYIYKKPFTNSVQIIFFPPLRVTGNNFLDGASNKRRVVVNKCDAIYLFSFAYNYTIKQRIHSHFCPTLKRANFNAPSQGRSDRGFGGCNTYIHTYIHTHIHTYIHTYIHTHTHTHIYIHTYINYI